MFQSRNNPPALLPHSPLLPILPVMFKRTFLAVLCLLPFASTAAESQVSRPRPVTPARWTMPDCSAIRGTGGVVISLDGGASTLPAIEPLTGDRYTFGLVSLDRRNTLLAVHGGLLLRSTDAGCSWATIHDFTPALFPPFLVAGRGGVAYAWSPNRADLFAIDPDGRVTPLLSPTSSIVGLGVDPADGRHLLIAGDNGAISESRDGGRTWSHRGGLRVDPPMLYRVAFDPRNVEHLVAGTLASGSWFSRDGGVSWTQSAGIVTGKPGTNVFNVAISPVNGEKVWAMGLDMSQETYPSHGRHISVSDDGGASFRPVVDETPAVKLINGPLLAPHPADESILLFVFGTYFQGYGTDLFRYDDDTRCLTMTHHPFHDIDAIAFHPRDPEVLYLGLQVRSSH
jgi:photosystem II stability/assembly factor-like uncharacterized protein